MQPSINYVFLVGWFVVVVFVFKEIVTGQHQRAKISFFCESIGWHWAHFGSFIALGRFLRCKSS